MINYTPAKEKGLGRSLFQRYAEALEKKDQRYAEALEKKDHSVGLCKEDSFIMLKVQYRMVWYSGLL